MQLHPMLFPLLQLLPGFLWYPMHFSDKLDKYDWFSATYRYILDDSDVRKEVLEHDHAFQNHIGISHILFLSTFLDLLNGKIGVGQFHS